jgi:ATP-dependent Lon protease
LKIIPVSHVSEVLKHALTSIPEKIEWDESAEEAAAAKLSSEGNQSATAH